MPLCVLPISRKHVSKSDLALKMELKQKRDLIPVLVPTRDSILQSGPNMPCYNISYINSGTMPSLNWQRQMYKKQSCMYQRKPCLWSADDVNVNPVLHISEEATTPLTSATHYNQVKRWLLPAHLHLLSHS